MIRWFLWLWFEVRWHTSASFRDLYRRDREQAWDLGEWQR